MRVDMKLGAVFLVIFVAGLGLPVQQACAIPALQLFIEGATYDNDTESWLYVAPSGGGDFTLWAIGNISGEGGKGTIKDVRLSAAYNVLDLPDPNTKVNILLTPTTASPEFHVDDSAIPLPLPVVRADLIKTSDGDWDVAVNGLAVTDGSSPVLGNGEPVKEKGLPQHGIFGQDGIVWQEFYLGHFIDGDDALIGDIIDEFPTPAELSEGGQINAYSVSVTNGDGDSLHGLEIHFDLYDSIESKNRAVFAPFSHDATFIPEPSSIIVWSLIGLAFAGTTWWRRRKRAGE